MRIWSEFIGIEFDIEKRDMLKMKSGKRQMMEGIGLANQDKTEHSEKSKPTNTWEYWKRAPLNMRR